mgnify:FL=1
MGGRGASSGVSDKGKRYGTEYTTLAQFGETKVIKMNGNNSLTAPMETASKGRIYASVDNNGDIKHITFHDSNRERSKQIDVKGKPHNGLMPHVHVGYEHNEIADRDLNDKERSFVTNLLNQWERKRKHLKI